MEFFIAVLQLSSPIKVIEEKLRQAGNFKLKRMAY